MFLSLQSYVENFSATNFRGGQNRGEGWTFYASKSPDVKGFKMQKSVDFIG